MLGSLREIFLKYANSQAPRNIDGLLAIVCYCVKKTVMKLEQLNAISH